MWLHHIWFRTYGPDTNFNLEQITQKSSSWWDISIFEVSCLYLIWFRNCGSDKKFDQGQITQKQKSESYDSCLQQIILMRYIHLWSFMTVCHLVQELWPGHIFWPRTGASKTDKIRVKILIHSTKSWWETHCPNEIYQTVKFHDCTVNSSVLMAQTWPLAQFGPREDEIGIIEGWVVFLDHYISSH